MIRRGEVWWATLGRSPRGASRQAVVVVQADEFNDSAIPTVVCLMTTSELRLADAPGNVRLSRGSSGLEAEVVVNVAHVVTLEKRALVERVGRVPAAVMRDIDAGLRLALALDIG